MEGCKMKAEKRADEKETGMERNEGTSKTLFFPVEHIQYPLVLPSIRADELGG